MSLNSTSRKEIRRFGLIAFVFFGCLTGVAIWREGKVLTYFFGCLGLIGLGLLLIPGLLAPVYYGWIRVAHFISRMVTLVILTLAYFLVITPAGLIKRVFGGIPLPLKPDSDLTTYWVTRAEPAQPKERFFKRF